MSDLGLHSLTMFGLYWLNLWNYIKPFFSFLPQMWKRKAKKAAGKGSTLIKTGKVPALAAAKQQAQAQPVPIRHGGHHPSAQKASAAITAAMLTKAAKQAVEEIPAKVGFVYYTKSIITAQKSMQNYPVCKELNLLEKKVKS